MPAPVMYPVGYNTTPGQVPVNNMTMISGVSNVDIPQLYRPSRSRDNDRCYLCHQSGHWKTECPRRQRKAQGASTTRSGTKTYLKIFVAGRDSTCLLDTGCDRSMLPRRFVPHTPLSSIKVKVYAANGTTIPVLGTTNVNFEVAGVPVYCRFLVSDAVDEPMLSIDWLEANDCAWDFVRGTIRIAGKEVALVNRPRRPVIRRVYVEEDVVVPPWTEVNVPVRLAWTAYKRGANNTEWVLDPKQTSQGVLVARSLLPREDSNTFVRVVNLTDQPRGLQVESCMGSAYPAQLVDDRPSGRDSNPPDVGGGPEPAQWRGVRYQAPPHQDPPPQAPLFHPALWAQVI